VRRADNFTTFCANCPEIWEPQPPGTLRACPGLYRVCFTLVTAAAKEHIIEPYFCIFSEKNNYKSVKFTEV
jgi:hypothetical protein